ncbi:MULTISPECIES: TIGR02302 family protein [unclassified Haematobacter]|uniref:TIGR02302 family protein n=1 Tax=unclassified Haematobacter TaxID=2640585 RepID=UPI0025C573F6|nr:MULTISPECIES: TIGR02302 family protein [unclassified Haematobacter]
MTAQDRDPAAALDRLKWPLRLTRWGLVAERLTQAFWPVPVILFATLAIIFFGVLDAVSIEVAWAGAVLIVVGLVAAAALGARRFRWPSRAEAAARLDATLPGRPISALGDHIAIGKGDEAAQRVWRAHLARMAERTRGAKPVHPDLNVTRRDPYALRYVALTALVVGLMFGSVWRVASVADLAQLPGGGAVASGPSWEGWIQPPDYTGKPTLYLNDIRQSDLSVPVGSKVVLRLYGEAGSLTVDETVSGRTGMVDSASAPSQEFSITRSGRLNINGPRGAGWDVTTIADRAPSVELSGPIGREADGAMRQPFAAHDDYGVTAGQARMELDTAALDRRYGLTAEPEPRDALVVDLPMPITGSRADFTETLAENFSQHPWANLPVKISLTVQDAAGQTGAAEARSIVLPGRRFFDPLAAALIENRRDLLWSRENGRRSLQVLRAVTNRPEGFIRNQRAYLQLRVAMRQLETGVSQGLTAETRDEVAAALWDIAVLLEDGDLNNAMERLQRAQDRLSEAIRNGASDEEIAQLMQELQEAMNDYIRQLAEQQQNDPNRQTAEDQQGQEITGDQLQQMLDRLQQLMQEGRMAEAQQLLDQLRRMMENMRVTQGQGGQGSPGQQAMRDLAETLRQQQGLSDEAFQGMQGQQPGQGQQGQQGEGQQGQGGQQPGQGQGQGQGRQQGQGQGGGPGQGGSLADRQQGLRNQLDGLMQRGLPGLGTPEGQAGRDALGRAGRAMDEAEQALRDGDNGRALDRQADAMESMREGMRNLGDAMAQNRQQGQPGEGGGGDQFGSGDPNGQRDPLGRRPGEVGRGIGTQDSMLQGDDVYRRAQDILNELRRRSGEQERPDLERDYLRRLLDLF